MPSCKLESAVFSKITIVFLQFSHTCAILPKKRAFGICLVIFSLGVSMGV